MQLVHQEGDDRGIDVAGAGAHDEALQRGQSHRGIDGLAVLHRRDGGAVAEMADDDPQILPLLAENLRRALADIIMAGAVEAVAADLVVLVVFQRNRVQICFRRHRLMERGIKHRDHRHPGHELFAGMNAGQVRRVVERRKIRDIADGADHIVVDENCLVKPLSAVDDTMSDSTDLGEGGDHTHLRVQQMVDDRLDRRAVIRHRDLLSPLCSARRRVRDTGSLRADALAQTLGQHLLRDAVNQLILQRRTAAVNHQNVHICLLNTGAQYALPQ